MATNLSVSGLPVECRSCFLKCIGQCGAITHSQAEDLLWKLFHVALFPPLWQEENRKPQGTQGSLWG